MVSSTKEACNSNPIIAFKVVSQISLVWNTCTHEKTVETEFVVSPNFELLQGVTLPTLAQDLYYIRYTTGPPEAICGWSGPAVGDEVINKSRAKRAAKFWT